MDYPSSYTLEKSRVLLVGYPISHSLSPLLHNSVFKNLDLDWTYEKVETTSLDDALSALAAPGVVGASVTMPLKISVMPFLDEATPACRAIGSCNTIIMSPGSGKLSKSKYLTGDNTDCAGIREAIRSATKRDKAFMTAPASRPVLVIGGGGSSRSAVYALHTWLNASSIYLLNRCSKETDEVIAHFRPFGIDVKAVNFSQPAAKLPMFSYIIGCIPDSQPATEAEKAVRRQTEEILAQRKRSAYLLDMCYKPRWTSLLCAGARNGWTTIEGIEVLIHQGFQQDARWTGLPQSKIYHPEIAGLIRDTQAGPFASVKL